MDEQVIVSSPKRVNPLVNPNGLHLRTEVFGQAADDNSVFQCFRLRGSDIRKFRVHLDLDIVTIAETGVEEIGIQTLPVIRPSIKHSTLALTAIGKGKIGGGSIFRDDVRVDEDRTGKGRFTSQKLRDAQKKQAGQQRPVKNLLK